MCLRGCFETIVAQILDWQLLAPGVEEMANLTAYYVGVDVGVRTVGSQEMESQEMGLPCGGAVLVLHHLQNLQLYGVL
jgi:hypothetical protein